ncbi:hypothetical protein PTSG_04140 [Salpingoeca rosetta]|uniref:Uncharacterized protein n=1 Tax=Salpingoeca rosetta (strain ATCC 50818 / BSB-021) TaxID=946362 RepID=F2U6Q3_SALR5|nr:uncharacterized protein PTSG_04140 [Salpingoeca rosetta]EGD83535.1 hypothetical protein PTSG_04140 [Salpingoeca rosetta]|eukprot:XP_004995039.1 hypothetical protein PTSG_04140 [Salpingoeca rosetta]
MISHISRQSSSTMPVTTTTGSRLALLLLVLSMSSTTLSVPVSDTLGCKPIHGHHLIRKCGDAYFDLASVRGADGKTLLSTKSGDGFIYYLELHHNGVPHNLPNCTLPDGRWLGAQASLHGGGCRTLAASNLEYWQYDNSTRQLIIVATGGTNGTSLFMSIQCQLGAKYSTLRHLGHTGFTHNFLLNIPSTHCTEGPDSSPHRSGMWVNTSPSLEGSWFTSCHVSSTSVCFLVASILCVAACVRLHGVLMAFHRRGARSEKEQAFK